MKSSFQTILVVVFVVAFGAAVFVFSGLASFGNKNGTSSTPQGNVTIWGILPQNNIDQYISNFNIGSSYTLQYSQHDPATISQDLVVALANGAPPDIILFSSELFAQFRDKLYTVPYAAYSERTYRDTNIDGAQVFLTKDGAVGLPLIVDPVVVYYNKDLIAQASFVIPPETWANLQQSVPLLTKRDSRNNITQSAVALGTAQNIAHFKDILSTLFMQTGASVVAYNPVSDSYNASFGNEASTATVPAVQALDFYTSFSNPTNTNYSWNNALPNSLDYFLAGKSVFYIGRASELFAIQARNPNLNFDVSEVFQTDANARPITFGSFIAVGMLKNAPNPVAAYAAMQYLSSATSIDAFSKAFSLPPVRRDLLLVAQSNPYVAIFFKAALSAFAWPDPHPAQSDEVFRTMVTDVTSGRSTADSALYDASKSL